MITQKSDVPPDGAAKPVSTADKAKAVIPGDITKAPASSKPSNSAAQKFSAEFKKLSKNPINEDIQYSLWLTAKSSDPVVENGGQPSATPLTQLADKYAKLVKSQGVHYIEISNAFGMKITTEFWVKDGKFKKVEDMLKEGTVFDGKNYIKYKSDEKTGISYKKDNPSVSADIDIQSNGMLSKLAKASYQKKEDQKFETFDCSVFYMDMEVMGMKGSTLWVDNNTGMLVKNTTGDEKNGMSVYITKFETGGFGDEVFTVPADIKIQYK